MTAPHPPRVLFVCTANMNRSVSAAAWSQRWFSDNFVSPEIRSAGTHAYDGNPAAAYTVEAMHEHGFDLREHRTSRVTPEALAWADHVVVMEPMHLQALMSVAPEHEDKYVPMWPFIGDGDQPLVSDPHGGPLEGYREMALAIRDASERLVNHLLAARRRRRAER